MMTITRQTEVDTAVGLRLLDRLARLTADPPGVTRTAYGAGEEAAHRLFSELAQDLGLPVTQDFAGNTYATRAGRNARAKSIVIGSHMDSVPHGGNYDGAAGVAAGLAVLSGLNRASANIE